MAEVELGEEAVSPEVELPTEEEMEADDFEFDNEDVLNKEIKLTPGGEVTKEILVKGKGWEKPEKGDEVEVHYVGTLTDGSQFDSSRDRGQPFTFKLGQGQVIKGWDVGVASMKRGEKAKLTIASDYGYGASGSPPKIPGGATLVFEVELLSWKSDKDISGDGGVVKTVEAEGEGWKMPGDKDEVVVWYRARVEGADAPVAESGEQGVSFTLSEGHLCKAVALAVKTMKKGERAALKVTPEYGFGADVPSGVDVPPGATLNVELRLLNWRAVEDLSGDGGVVKKQLAEGEGWANPNAGATCTVSWRAAVVGGGEFDVKEEFQFVTEEEQLQPAALERAVMKMKKGETAEVTLSPQYAFGEAGCSGSAGSVPPGAAVVYTITLKDFVKAKEGYEMEESEKVEAATALKDRGNELFKAGKNALAVAKYKRAAECISYDDSFSADNKARSRAVKRSVNLNLAAVHLKAQEWREAKAACDKVLEGDSFNVKALYRRAQAFMGLQEWVEAGVDIRRAIEVDPDNRELVLLRKKLRVAEAASSKQEAKLYSAMFRPSPKAKVAPAAPANGTDAKADDASPAPEQLSSEA